MLVCLMIYHHQQEYRERDQGWNDIRLSSGSHLYGNSDEAPGYLPAVMTLNIALCRISERGVLRNWGTQFR